MVGQFFQPRAAAGLQAESDRGLDFTGIGFCQANVRKRENHSGIVVYERKFIYRESKIVVDKLEFFPGGCYSRKVGTGVPQQLFPFNAQVYCAINIQNVQD